MPITRRHFVRMGAGSLALLAMPPGIAWASHPAFSQRKLLFLHLRGGADGLGLVFPRDGVDGTSGSSAAHLNALRPTLYSAFDANSLDAGGGFRFHENLGGANGLTTHYANGELAVIHCVNAPGASHSHFDAQDGVDRAAPRDRFYRRGWLHAMLPQHANVRLESDPLAPLGGVGLAGALPTSLAGSLNTRTTSFPSINNLSILDNIGGGFTAPLRQLRTDALVEAFGCDPSNPYPCQPTSAVTGAGNAALSAIGELEPYRDVTVPGWTSFTDAARLLTNWTGTGAPPSPHDVSFTPTGSQSLDLGVRAVAMTIGGWDHHSSEATQLPGLASALAGGLNQFWNYIALTPEWQDEVMVVVLSEFGRTVDENGSNGTDHGAGGLCLVMGKNLQAPYAGSVYSRGVGDAATDYVMPSGLTFPSLYRDPATNYDRDLAATIDFRDVFAEIVDKHLGVANVSGIIPSYDDPTDVPHHYTSDPANYLGLLA